MPVSSIALHSKCFSSLRCLRLFHWAILSYFLLHLLLLHLMNMINNIRWVDLNYFYEILLISPRFGSSWLMTCSPIWVFNLKSTSSLLLSLIKPVDPNVHFGVFPLFVFYFSFLNFLYCLRISSLDSSSRFWCYSPN